MAVILDILTHIFALDLAWLFSFTMQNILWLFLFAAAAIYFYPEKKWFWATVFVSLLVLVFIDFSDTVGWVILSKDYLSVLMLAAIAVLVFAEFDSWGSKHLALVNTLRAIVVLVAYNLFFM